MKIPKNMCRILPPLVARNPCLIDEFAGKTKKMAFNIPYAIKLARSRASARIRAELGIVD